MSILVVELIFLIVEVSLLIAKRLNPTDSYNSVLGIIAIFVLVLEYFRRVRDISSGSVGKIELTDEVKEYINNTNKCASKDTLKKYSNKDQEKYEDKKTEYEKFKELLEKEHGLNNAHWNEDDEWEYYKSQEEKERLELLKDYDFMKELYPNEYDKINTSDYNQDGCLSTLFGYFVIAVILYVMFHFIIEFI